MLNPTPLPMAPGETAALLPEALLTDVLRTNAQLTDVLAALSREHAGKLPRDVALAAVRRHLVRIQQLVRESFEQDSYPACRPGACWRH